MHIFLFNDLSLLDFQTPNFFFRDMRFSKLIRNKKRTGRVCVRACACFRSISYVCVLFHLILPVLLRSVGLDVIAD